ncbi:hypothetical protein [Fodinibius halophilus]|uniref:Uncharacterized protein n=1 Tax=Fodinibius halophilus TaxID=1736908 RepID=A0A6M1TCH0_9BACT|nr:hypothetical protein [Fodinibius halophilus]NGP89701.1 hypothetical protein [Fodinibius halophilus]
METFIEEFHSNIEKKAQSRSIETINHSGPHESAIILGTIFKYAKNHVRMYVGDFCGDISNNSFYLEHLTNFLEADKKLNVLVKDLHSTNPSEVYKKISLYDGFSDNVNIVHSNVTLPPGGDMELLQKNGQ